jgi:hypothetical protein
MNHHNKKPKNPITYGVTYGAHGNSFTTTFTDPQSDGVSAEQKALDYFYAAAHSPESVMAWCEITRNGEPWRDSRFPISNYSLSSENKERFFRLIRECKLLRDVQWQSKEGSVQRTCADELASNAEKKLKEFWESHFAPRD